MRNGPQFIEVDFPVVPCRLVDASGLRVEGNVDRNAPIESNGGEVLVEEGFEEDNLIPMLQECHKNGILAWVSRVG
jgi:hypothetical protein